MNNENSITLRKKTPLEAMRDLILQIRADKKGKVFEQINPLLFALVMAVQDYLLELSSLSSLKEETY